MEQPQFTFPAYRPNYSSILRRIILYSILYLAIIGAAIWYLGQRNDSDDFILFIVILVPSLALIYIIRRDLNSAETETTCTLTEDSIKEVPKNTELKTREIPIAQIQSCKEYPGPISDQSPYLLIKIRDSREKIMVSSRDLGAEDYNKLKSILEGGF